MKVKETKRGSGRKKGYEIYKASKRIWDADLIGLGKKQLHFGKNRCFYTMDSGLARTIDQTLGAGGSRDVIVCEVDNPGPVTPRRVFSFSRIPWKEEDAKPIEEEQLEE